MRNINSKRKTEKMTKADIVNRVHEETGFSKKESMDMVECVLELVKNTLESGENVKISGFGNFIVMQKNDRKGRNPQTGEAMTIGARHILTLKPSLLLRKTINS
jgi:integration host factor subunit alpha